MENHHLLDLEDTSEDPSWKHPHAFHLNLPPNHLDDDGIPLITKYANKKSRHIIKLVESMKLEESMFISTEATEQEEDDASQMDDEVTTNSTDSTLSGLLRKCTRLQSQLSSLEGLKHCGLSRLETSRIILHILKLSTATITFEKLDTGKQQEPGRKVTLHYENVGCICTSSTTEAEMTYHQAPDGDTLEADIVSRPFALPSPAREVLLSLLVSLLSNKGPLRSVSNAAVYTKNDDPSRFLLIIHWRALLRMLLRTAPYLDEHKVGSAPLASNSRNNTIVKRSVQMIRDARHFFDQGLRPNKPQSTADDRTACEVWDMVKTDVMYHSHTNACYRALVMLYLFQPSRCSSEYYVERMPLWFESWTNIDRCPEIDFLWLALFCRARKHLPINFDWSLIRNRLLTHSQYWLQLPIGGGTLDKSFPNASTPRSRTCPSRLKVFAGASSSYEEGIDFVAKVTKLLVIGLGIGPLNSDDQMSQGTSDVLRFLSFVTPYFHPSNLGSWTFTLGAFLHYFCYELCSRVGVAGSMAVIQSSKPELYEALCEVEPSLTVAAVPPHETVALLHALLPLCQQALYSKNGHVGRAGEAAMLYLAQIDPARVTPAFIDFATRALDITAVNLAHQAPAALSALTRLLQPSLRICPKILLVRLPDILRLSLAGIDSNDQNKTIRTLILYRNLTSWIPVGGSPATWKRLEDSPPEANDGTLLMEKDLLKHLYKPTTSQPYLSSLDALPDSSLLKQGTDMSDVNFDLLMGEASYALSDWALEFLDRIYSLLRASGEREKTGKTASGVATRHSSADVQQARNFSRVLKECLTQTFAAMNGDIHKAAVQSVVRFMSEETLPSAAKDSSLLCQAAAAARVHDGNVTSPGLDGLVPMLLDGLDTHSSKTVSYRLRCLSGAVRSCGVALNQHMPAISGAIGFALRSKDKHVVKTGCKLLRHSLASLCESYTLACDAVSRGAQADGKEILGKSAQLKNDPVQWHVPNAASVELAWGLLNDHVWKRICMFSSFSRKPDANGEEGGYTFDVHELRKCLRVVRYALRGGAGVMLDPNFPDTKEETEESSDFDLCLFPYEQAVLKLLRSASDETCNSMLQFRGRLCGFIVNLISFLASESFNTESSVEAEGQKGSNTDTEKKYLALVSSDAKVCKEASDISLLLLTRRGASFRSQEGKTIWKAQKQLATDFALLAQSDHLSESMQRAQLFGSCRFVLFKDGEDAGKTLPRRLLIARMQLFRDSLQRTASFEVPRRLKRLSKVTNHTRKTIFSIHGNDPSSDAMQLDNGGSVFALDNYEGLVDALFSLCCHSNTQVRASAIGVVDYAITRFGWLLQARVPRLLGAVKLEDTDMHGKFGIPSCSSLKQKVDGQGKRKRLAEAMKGVCSILAIPRAGKLLLGSEKNRLEFIKTTCGTDDLVSLMPTEEMQKMVHYLHSLFSPFRLKFYSIPRASKKDSQLHRECLDFLLDILSTEKQVDGEEAGDAKSAHWRKLLHSCWFLTVQVDSEDLQNEELLNRLWKLCFQILVEEHGQPLQRVALGLFGRLVMITTPKDWDLLRSEVATASFCKAFGNALVYDHKEDSSVGGGHDAQWAAGVADMIRDSSRNIAPRSLFPFQRTNQSSGTFKVSHAQLIEQILLGLSEDVAEQFRSHLLVFAREVAASPPSEDQRNQQCTSAEIFAGITRALLQSSGEKHMQDAWLQDLLPFLDDVIPKIPTSLSGAYFDALRFAIQFSPPEKFFAFSDWLFRKIEESLWVPEKGSIDDGEAAEDDNDKSSTQGLDGFTAQSKWLYLCSALLVELDESEAGGPSSRLPWYLPHLVKQYTAETIKQSSEDALKKSWSMVSQRLLPRLLEALGHPYESCRDHVAGCLFRICYCHRRMIKKSDAQDVSQESVDPGLAIVEKLLDLQKLPEGGSFQNRLNALITTRRFFSYCIHFGESKHEFADYIIPLLPLAFEVLKSSADENGEGVEGDTVARRALETEVVKGYRYTIAELSVASVMSYGATVDITRTLNVIEDKSTHSTWQVRHACANFLRCFQGSHKFLFSEGHADKITAIVAVLLADDRREVSSAAMAAVTGVIAALPSSTVSKLVRTNVSGANRSTMKKKKGKPVSPSNGNGPSEEQSKKEQARSKLQQSSVFFLCAVVLSQPYDTPAYIPKALAAISRHSFERNAPLGVRDIVKKCCSEYKRTHMSDNWQLHRKKFTQEEFEALEDVVSSPHYYA